MTRAERKRVVRSVVEPALKSKKDRTQKAIYERIKPGKDGKIRTVLSSTGTETGRLNSSESLVEESTNLQNLSKITALEDELYTVRDCIMADPGYVLLAVDYDKAEAVCLAAYCRDWTFYDRLVAGEDVHSWHAGHFFGVQEWIDGGKADPMHYSLSKNATFASNYMASIATIRNTVNKKWELIGRKVTTQEITDINLVYMNLHPLQRWWGETSEELTRKGYLVNAFGFKRTFFEPDVHKRLKEGLAFFPQSTVAANINRSLDEIYERVDEPGRVEVLLQVHDELIFQVKQGLEVSTFKKVQRIMEQPFTVHDREIYIPASGKVGERWGHMTKISTA